MANSTLLSLFQTSLQAAGVAGYGMPATVIANTNQDVVQTLALVHAAGGDMGREFQWQQMTKQYLFTAVYYTYTGDVTSGSTSVTNMSSIAGVSTNPTYFQVTGTGIPQDCFVTAASGTTVTLNQEATATGTTVSLTFSQVLFAPPSDFDRLIDSTQWDKSKHWQMLGPETAQQREWLRSGYISTGPRIRYWQMGGYWQIWPPLGAEENLATEYVSKWWIVPTGAVTPTKEIYTVDTDFAIFPDPLMRSLIRLKYFEAKGFDTTALYREFLSQRDLAFSHDSGSPNLSMAPQPTTALLGWGNIPDSSYGT